MLLHTRRAAVEPTIAGIRGGRDEVLERAVRYLLETARKQQNHPR